MLQVILGFFILAGAKDLCEMKNSVEATHLPKYERDYLGICGATAKKIILSQLACRRADCKNPDEFNFSAVALRAGVTGNALPLDSCAPVRTLSPKPFKEYSVGTDAFDTLSFNQQIARLQLMKRLCDEKRLTNCDPELAEWVKDPAETVRSYWPVNRVDDFTTLVRKLDFEKCERKTVPLHTERKVALMSTAVLKEKISANVPVSVHICLKKKCKEQEHVTVISGYREYCCKNSCDIQIKLYDFQGAEFLPKTRDGWVKFSEFQKFRPTDFTTLENPFNSEPSAKEPSFSGVK